MAKVKGGKYTKTSDKPPPLHKLPMHNADNMKNPGSDGAAHHPNGEHKATNSKMGPC